jgi:hypothetical protein
MSDRMIERGDRAGFAFQPVEIARSRDERRRQHLHGYAPAKLQILGGVDFAHPAFAQQTDDSVVSESRPNHPADNSGSAFSSRSESARDANSPALKPLSARISSRVARLSD